MSGIGYGDNGHYKKDLSENAILPYFQGYLYNFHKEPEKLNNRGISYEYRSVMHYGWDLSKFGNMTIQTLDPSFENIIGKACHLSPAAARLRQV